MINYNSIKNIKSLLIKMSDNKSKNFYTTGLSLDSKKAAQLLNVTEMQYVNILYSNYTRLKAIFSSRDYHNDPIRYEYHKKMVIITYAMRKFSANSDYIHNFLAWRKCGKVWEKSLDLTETKLLSNEYVSSLILKGEKVERLFEWEKETKKEYDELVCTSPTIFAKMCDEIFTDWIIRLANNGHTHDFSSVFNTNYVLNDSDKHTAKILGMTESIYLSDLKKRYEIYTDQFMFGNINDVFYNDILKLGSSYMNANSVLIDVSSFANFTRQTVEEWSAKINNESNVLEWFLRIETIAILSKEYIELYDKLFH